VVGHFGGFHSLLIFDEFDNLFRNKIHSMKLLQKLVGVNASKNPRAHNSNFSLLCLSDMAGISKMRVSAS
jgi:hypothetical protein